MERKGKEPEFRGGTFGGTEKGRHQRQESMKGFRSEGRTSSGG